MPYQEILARAWRIFKRQRILWLFGILTACSGGVYGRVTLPSFNIYAPFTNKIPSLPPQIAHFSDQLVDFIGSGWLLTLLLPVVMLVWMILAMLLRSFAEPALIRGTLKAIENDHPLTFGEIARAGTPFFGRMLTFYLLVGGSAFILLMILLGVFGLILLATSGFGLMCLMPLVFVFTPLIWLLELYLVLVTMALVVEDLEVITALQRGWQMLKQNFWSAVFMGFLLTFIHIVVSFLKGIIVIATLILVGGGYVMLANVTASAAPFLILGALALGFIILLSLVVMGLLQTYLESAWVLTYRHFLGYPLDPETAALSVSAPEDMEEEAEEGEAPEEPETAEENPPQASEPPLSAPETP